MKTPTPFDVSEYLDSDEKISAYLSAVLEDNDVGLLIQAIGHVAKAKGMAVIAKESGLGRESLYKSFCENAQPRFDTVIRVLHAMNIDLKFESKSEDLNPTRATKVRATKTKLTPKKKQKILA
jgi:probable addiction module antidote protein